MMTTTIEQLKSALPEATIELRNGAISIDTGRYVAVVTEEDGLYSIEWMDTSVDNPRWHEDEVETIEEIKEILIN